MSIIFDARTATDHFPGIGRYVVNLTQALTQIASDLPITLLRAPTTSAQRLKLPAHLPAVACPISPFSLRQQWAIPAQLRRLKATLYHSPYYLMPYATGLPTVVTCYDLIPLIYPEYFSATQRLIYWAAHKLATRIAHVVLAISQATQADLIRHLSVNPQKITVTPLAADLSFQSQSPERIAALRSSYALPNQYMLYVGSNKPHKNLQLLVQAFRESKIPVPLIIAGHWDERYPEAKKLVEEYGWQDRVKFIGPVAEADLPALYSSATLFAFPSQYEGFGLPVLEAMACGAPVVCSNASSLPEVVGEAGLLLPPHDQAAWVATLNRVLTDADLRADLRARGLARARQFTWEATARQTAQVYTEALNL